MNTGVLSSLVSEWLLDTAIPEYVLRQATLPMPLSELRSIVAVVGPRRSGKTVFLYQLIKQLLESGVDRKETLFIDFEDYRLRSMVPEDVEELLAVFVKLTGNEPRYLFFDEVQNLPQWDRVLRTLCNRGRYSIVVTGSNSHMLSGEIASTLRGRYQTVLMLPFSFREYLSFIGLSWNELTVNTPQKGRVISAFDDYLKFGGFPDVCKRTSPNEKRRLLQNYHDTVVYKDILDRHKVKARSLLDMMMTAVLNGSAELFSISAFEKQLKSSGVPGSKRTVSSFMVMMQEAFFIITNEKFSFSARKRIMNPKKVYLMDTGYGLLSHEFSENLGKRLETCVAIEYFRREEKIFYFKDKRECDFVIKRGTTLDEAVQVCWNITSQNEKRELEGLREAMSNLNIPRGLILTYDQEGNKTVNGVEIPVVPVWKWLLRQTA